MRPELARAFEAMDAMARNGTAGRQTADGSKQAIFRNRWVEVKDHWLNVRHQPLAELARKAHVSQTTFLRWENEGVTKDKDGIVSRVCSVVGIPLRAMWQTDPIIFPDSDDLETTPADRLRDKAESLIRAGGDVETASEMLDVLIRRSTN